jgi:hypothetical protein
MGGTRCALVSPRVERSGAPDSAAGW